MIPLEIFSNLGSGFAGLAGLIGLIIALCHLKGIKATLENSNLMSNFGIEFELNRRKEQLTASMLKGFEILNGRERKELNDDEKKHLSTIEEFTKEAYENYLNILDRFAYFILKKKLDEEDFRTEYRYMLSDTMEKDSFGVFSKPNRYRNMTKLREVWMDK